MGLRSRFRRLLNRPGRRPTGCQAERNLAALGEQDRLRESRLIVQRALEDRLRDTVEGTLGRRAIAVMSAIDVDRDVCAEILTLEPRADARTPCRRTGGRRIP
jgi:hypothetical protein